MFTLNGPDLVFFESAAELYDPRGGMALDVSSNRALNQLHTPYRGAAVDFQAPNLDPSGRPMTVMVMMPGANDPLSQSSLAKAIEGLSKRETVGLGGYAAQHYYPSFSAGVSND